MLVLYTHIAKQSKVDFSSKANICNVRNFILTNNTVHALESASLEEAAGVEQVSRQDRFYCGLGKLR